MKKTHTETQKPDSKFKALLVQNIKNVSDGN